MVSNCLKLSLVTLGALMTGQVDARIEIAGVDYDMKKSEKPRGPIGPTVVLLDIAD